MSQGIIPKRNRRYFGWTVVAVSGVFHALFGGLYHTGISVYFLPLTRDFGISYTKMSLAFALRTLEGGVEGPLAGHVVDRFGPRVVILVGVVLGGVGFLLLAITRSYPMFLLVFLALLTIGFSAPFHGIAAGINLWFRRRLGLAMSLASSGSAIGGFLLTPAVAWVVLTHGWRWTAFLSGLLLLVVGPPLANIIRKPVGNEASLDDPRESVLSAGALKTASVSHETAPASTSLIPDFDPDFTVREALKTRVYWLLAMAIGLRLMAQSALMVHVVPILVSKGIGEGTAASLVAFMSLIRLPGMIGAGLVADVWSRPKTAALFMVAGVLTAATVAWGPRGFATGIAFMALFACAQSSNSITWALIGQFFGRRNFGSLRGGVTLVQSLMSTSGPIMAGWVFDRTGDYTFAFLGIGILYGLSAMLFWSLRDPVRPERLISPHLPTAPGYRR